MIAIYEPLYLPGQTLTDPAFRPLRLKNNDYADWREFRIIIDMYRRGAHRKQRFTGLLSPKFGLKTGLTGQQFIDFIQDNADADVCFANPFPQLAYISYNVWMQGELAHNGLVSRSQRLLDASGVDLQIPDIPRHGPNLLSYCNYWVGTEKFWDDYVGGFLMPLAVFLENHPTSEASKGIFDPTAHTDPSPFLPFMIERLFSSYLSKTTTSVLARGYLIDPITLCLNQFERDIVTIRRGEIDAADAASLFPDELKANMSLVCALRQIYIWAHYSNRPHPHTGYLSKEYHCSELANSTRQFEVA